jgi:hypothetical protein
MLRSGLTREMAKAISHDKPDEGLFTVLNLFVK